MFAAVRRTGGLLLTAAAAGGIWTQSVGQVPADDAPGPPIDPALAAAAFEEVEDVCTRDGGALWGTSLCGPVLFVDPGSRAVAANRADAEGRLKSEHGIHTGTLPPDTPIANTAMTWAGVDWAMVMWPLPQDEFPRIRLLLHEAWHRIQDDLGLPGSNPSNAHMESLEGRYLLRLEWRALMRALESEGTERLRAMEDALVFRARRHQLFPDAAAEERQLILHEGLAQYTGVVLAAEQTAGRGAAARAAAEHAAAALREAEHGQAFARGFAYASGPAYGVLLDDLVPDWRAGIDAGTDLGDRLRQAAGLEISGRLAAEVALRGTAYAASELLADEEERDRERRARVAGHRARFVDGPLLTLPLREPRISFHPHQVEPLGEIGTVYNAVHAMDQWGVLEAPGGALIRFEKGTLVLPAPSDPLARPLAGDGWTLELEPDWELAPGERAGDYALVRRDVRDRTCTSSAYWAPITKPVTDRGYVLDGWERMAGPARPLRGVRGSCVEHLPRGGRPQPGARVPSLSQRP